MFGYAGIYACLMTRWRTLRHGVENVELKSLMPSPIAAYAPPPVEAGESDFSVTSDATPLSEPTEAELDERRSFLHGLSHFFSAFSTEPKSADSP